MVYAYKSNSNKLLNGHLIEVQIRTNLQHIWATAVELVGTCIDQDLKSGYEGDGDREWLRFFALISQGFALEEKTAHVPDTPQDRTSLVEELRRLSTKLDALKKISSYGTATASIERHGQSGARGYFLIWTSPADQKLYVSSYSSSQYELAFTTYTKKESDFREISGLDAVLVSAKSIKALRRAYPNYFTDSKKFLAAVNRLLG